MMKAVFLDRDGTLIENMEYSSDLRKLKLLPRVSEALKRLQDNHFKLIVITNQSGIGRGLLTLRNVIDQHTMLCQKLAGENVTIEGYRICPHHPDENCRCRKPKPWMIIDAAEEFGIELSQSWMIGDALTDVEAGYYAGCKTALIDPDSQYIGNSLVQPNVIDLTLAEVVDLILEESF